MQIAITAQLPLRYSETTSISIASAVLSLLAALALIALSVLEHRNAPRPSFIISIYLILSLFFDITRTRTMWLGNSPALAGRATAALMLQGAVLLLETVDKRKMLLGEYKILSSEATSSLPDRKSVV